MCGGVRGWYSVPVSRVTIVVVADVPRDGLAAFQEYERKVLALLGEHGGQVERRLRTADELVEVHVVSFGSREGLGSYLNDHRRLVHRELLAGVDLVQRVLEVTDVPER